jgi:D-alanine-D-alanine ligase
MEVLFKKAGNADLIYSFHNKANYEQIIEYRVPEPEVAQSCAEVALSSWKALGCRDGGRVDIRMDSAGKPNFIEVNPLAGLNPVHSDLPILCRLHGISFQELLERILQSAIQRTGAAR